MRRQVMDARAWRGWGSGNSDHYLVAARINVQRKWIGGRRRGRDGAASGWKVEKLSDIGKKEEYKRAVEERLGRYEWERMRDVEGMNEKFVEEIFAASVWNEEETQGSTRKNMVV